MRANRQGGEWCDYCFYKDTVGLAEDEKELIRAEIREKRRFLKERRVVSGATKKGRRSLENFLAIAF